MAYRTFKEAKGLTNVRSATSRPVGFPPPTKKPIAIIGRIMYIEAKGESLTGPARIGRVRFSKTGKTIYYQSRTFHSLKGAGFKSNYFDLESGESYWISGPKRNGQDSLYGGNLPVEIDEDVREEYWRNIRRKPESIAKRSS
ncbi:MAG: 1-deoxy-D-xylulose-5-phosphate synthase [Verrucomicrobiota bacterium]